MVTIGVLVRAELGSIGEVESRLAALDGAITIELEERGSIGLVLRGESLDQLYEKLRGEVQATRGVLAAWPVHVQLEPMAEANAGVEPPLNPNPEAEE